MKRVRKREIKELRWVARNRGLGMRRGRTGRVRRVSRGWLDRFMAQTFVFLVRPLGNPAAIRVKAAELEAGAFNHQTGWLNGHAGPRAGGRYLERLEGQGGAF